MTALETARTLGAEHGTRDAEAWLDANVLDDLDREEVAASETDGWCGLPEPDLTERRKAGGYGKTGDGGARIRACEDAYESAYRAAVENTIRQAVQ